MEKNSELPANEMSIIWLWKHLIIKIASSLGIIYFGSLNIMPFSHQKEKNLYYF